MRPPPPNNRYLEKSALVASLTKSFPIMYNTYGPEYKSFEKYMEISEKITDFG